MRNFFGQNFRSGQSVSIFGLDIIFPTKMKRASVIITGRYPSGSSESRICEVGQECGLLAELLSKEILPLLCEENCYGG